MDFLGLDPYWEPKNWSTKNRDSKNHDPKKVELLILIF